MVKVPLAVCIRSVQAGVYPNAWVAACRICSAAGALAAGHTISWQRSAICASTVPLAGCIRSVQAGVYPNAWVAACRICSAAGVLGAAPHELAGLVQACCGWLLQCAR